MNLPNVKKTRKTNFSDGLLQPHNQQAYQKIKDGENYEYQSCKRVFKRLCFCGRV